MPGLVGYIQYREEQKEIRALFEKWSGDSRETRVEDQEDILIVAGRGFFDRKSPTARLNEAN